MMNRRGMLLAWTAVAVVLCLRANLWDRELGADNRLYFYMAERAASGVPPHVSAPDVKNQLATLTEAASIVVGRTVGLDDVRAGRLASMAMLVAGVCGVGLLVLELGASAAAASIAAISTLAFGALTEHAAIGFNPKTLLFALIAWTHVLVARGRFGRAGVAAAAAMLCWQPAAAVGVGALAAAFVQAPRLRRVALLAVGGIAAVAAYEAYFAWYGALAPQLFQAYGLPLGSVHDAVDVREGLWFVAFCERRGLDHWGLPAAAFVLFVVERCWWLLRRNAASSDRAVVGANAAAAAPAAVVALVVGGAACVAFTLYDHQAEPDRFLLSVYFAAALGMLADRVLRWVRSIGGPSAMLRAEAALVVVLLILAGETSRGGKQDDSALERQFERARIVRMYAEAYGNVWAFGCSHLLGLAHLTNYHPLAYLWDDLEVYVDGARFVPELDGRLPDVILAGRRLPGEDVLKREYTPVPVPALAEEHVRLYVRREARIEATDLESDAPEKLPRRPARQPQRKQGHAARRQPVVDP